jgi:hypothetical protein
MQMNAIMVRLKETVFMALLVLGFQKTLTENWKQPEKESLKTGKINYFQRLRQITGYIRQYFFSVNKKVLFACSALAAIAIFVNYHFGLDDNIRKNPFLIKLFAWWLVFGIAFLFPWLFYRLFTHSRYSANPSFLLLCCIAPAVFSLKLALDIPGDPVFYWPVLLLMIVLILWIIWLIFDKKYQPFYGIKTKGINWKPYLLMLLLMVPLIALAATQKDFQAVYPKLQSMVNEGGKDNWWYKILYELSYGSDFIGIELFFRGFLVLAFAKWAGKDAILPMALFYCTIHFGKPLGECISSYFGGMILGIVVYNTRSIFGGLIVHLGIAWMMELAGWIAQ